MRRNQIINPIGQGISSLALPRFLFGNSGFASIMEAGNAASATNIGFFDQFGLSKELVQRVLQRALNRGGDFCDIFFQHAINHVVAMEDGAVNKAYTVVDVGAGIRVLNGDSTGFAYCEALDEAALLDAASFAATIANSDKSQSVNALQQAAAVGNHYEISVPWETVGVEQKLPLLEMAEQIAFKQDSRINKVSVSLSDESSHILIANSEGLFAEDVQPMGYMNINCVAKHQGRTEASGKSLSGRQDISLFSNENITKIATEAAVRTVELFDAVKAPVGELPVVLAPGVSGMLLHEAIGHGMEADFNRKGISIYADRIGKRIAPAEVNIYDDGTRPHSRGSINIDDEGTQTQKTQLVENGILTSYLHDRISAKHYNVASTGSARRESFRFPPVPRMRNTYMTAGPHDPAEIIKSVKKGIYAEVFSNGQVNIGAGDFTFYLKHGRLIEDGRLGPVIKDANMIGSGPRVLENIRMVGNDMKLYTGGGTCGKDGQGVPVSFGLPTVLADGVSIGGYQ